VQARSPVERPVMFVTDMFAGIIHNARKKARNEKAETLLRLHHDQRTTPACQEIKGWRRSKKIALIQAMNPRWHDLAAEWQDLYKPVNRVHADSRQILHGLKAVQDDAIRE